MGFRFRVGGGFEVFGFRVQATVQESQANSTLYPQTFIYNVLIEIQIAGNLDMLLVGHDKRCGLGRFLTGRFVVWSSLHKFFYKHLVADTYKACDRMRWTASGSGCGPNDCKAFLFSPMPVWAAAIKPISSPWLSRASSLK